MGRRKRKRASRGDVDVRSLSDERLAEKLSTLLESGKYQRAIGIGKEIRRRGRLEENRDLLERAYRLRATELVRKNLYRESAVIVENALSAGILSDGLVDVSVRCHLATGQIDEAREVIELAQRMGADATQASQLIVDMVVLSHPRSRGQEPAGTSAQDASGNEASREEPGLPFEMEPGLAADLQRLERAFRSYERGLDEEARAELRGIPRRSPLARWRILLGGLIARATGDLSTARSCWERIPTPGPCGMVARGLLDELPADPTRSALPGASLPAATGDTATLETDSSHGAAEPALMVAFPSDPRRRLLERIAECCRDDDEAALILAVQTAVNRWPGGLSSSERRRLFRAIGGAIEPTFELYERLTPLLGELPENQMGLRQAALVAERTEPEYAHELWDAYLEDLDDVRFEPRLALRARALILERMGDLALGLERQALAFSSHFAPKLDAEDIVHPGAADCYRASIELDPATTSIRRKLATLLRERGETRQAEQILAEILRIVPADVETLLELGESAYGRKAYRKAFKYFEEAYRFEPLNSKVQTKLSECLDASAWRRARKQRYDLARQDWERAVEVWRGSPPAKLLVRWAAAEAADGERERSEEIFHRALDTGLWRAEAELELVDALAGLNVDQDLYTARRDAMIELVREASADAASVECIGRLRARVTDLSRRDRHLSRIDKMLHKHVRRASGRPLARGSRLELCRLFETRGLFDLTLAYAAAGRKQFPEEPHFTLHEAEACLELNRDLGGSLRTALDRAISSAAENGDLSLAERLARLRVCSDWHPRRRRKPQRSGSVFDAIFADRFDEPDLFDEPELGDRERGTPF